MLEAQGFEVAGIFETGTELVEQFEPGMADILFMDIYLGQKTSGIEAAEEIKKISDIPVIYITKNEDEYLKTRAINETNAVHYITKPFNKREISVAIEFALKSLRANKFNRLNADSPGTQDTDTIFLKNGLGYKRILVSDIMLLQADRSYCKFTFKEGKDQLFTENLSYFEDKFKFSKELVRIHRSYIVNINFIERVHENRLWVKGIEIPIGRTYKPILSKRFKFV